MSDNNEFSEDLTPIQAELALPPERDDPNPYAPSQVVGVHAMQLPTANTEAESIRRQFLKHEVSVKSIGSLFYLGAIIGVLGGVGHIVGAIGLANEGNPTPEAGELIAFMSVLGPIALAIGIFQFFVAYGLRRLRNWTRIAGSVLSAPLMLISIPIGTVMGGYFIYLLCSKKGAYVFSPPYKEIIKQTPHVKLKPPIAMIILLVVLVIILIGAIAIAINA